MACQQGLEGRSRAPKRQQAATEKTLLSIKNTKMNDGLIRDRNTKRNGMRHTVGMHVEIGMDIRNNAIKDSDQFKAVRAVSPSINSHGVPLEETVQEDSHSATEKRRSGQ